MCRFTHTVDFCFDLKWKRQKTRVILQLIGVYEPNPYQSPTFTASSYGLYRPVYSCPCSCRVVALSCEIRNTSIERAGSYVRLNWPPPLNWVIGYQDMGKRGTGGYPSFGGHSYRPLTTLPRGDGALFLEERFPIANRSFLGCQMFLNNGLPTLPTLTVAFWGQFLFPRTAIAFYSAILRFKGTSIASFNFSKFTDTSSLSKVCSVIIIEASKHLRFIYLVY